MEIEYNVRTQNHLPLYVHWYFNLINMVVTVLHKNALNISKAFFLFNATENEIGLNFGNV